MVAHGGHPAIDGAGSDRDEYLAVLAELAQHMHIVRVAHPALDQAYVARIAMFDVGKRRAIELDMLQQGHQSFIHIEEGHMAAETTGQRCGRDPDFTDRKSTRLNSSHLVISY